MRTADLLGKFRLTQFFYDMLEMLAPTAWKRLNNILHSHKLAFAGLSHIFHEHGHGVELVLLFIIFISKIGAQRIRKIALKDHLCPPDIHFIDPQVRKVVRKRMCIIRDFLDFYIRIVGKEGGFNHTPMTATVVRGLHALAMTTEPPEERELVFSSFLRFLSIFADQLENGIYTMETRDILQKDPITGENKTVKFVSISRDKDGNPIRAEESILKKYGIKIQPPSITRIVYEPKVEEQIQQQRDNTLAIQTSQAQARKAEQDAITSVKSGEAKVAEAKWIQEVQKATEVTKAEQLLAVANLDARKQKEVAELILEAADSDFRVRTYLGHFVQRNNVVLQEGRTVEQQKPWFPSVNTLP